MIKKHTTTGTSLAKINYDATLSELYKASESANTIKAKKSDITNFIEFCMKHQMSADSAAFLQYIGFLATEYKYSTLNRRCVHVTQWLKEKNRYDFTREQIEGLTRIKKGAKNKLHTEKPLKKAPALKQSALYPILDSMKRTKKSQLRDYTLLLVTYFGGFRISEALNMKVEDITFTPEGAVLTVPKSKNHQTELTYKLLPFASNHCPVIALRKLLQVTGINSGFVFQTFISKERFNSGKPVSNVHAWRLIKRLSAQMFSTHSLRAGFVTDAYERGATPTEIMKQTGHKSIAQVMGYNQSIDITKNNAVSYLV